MPKIMVVDDMPIFREPIAASLRLAGFTAVTAGSGIEALRMLPHEKPDLILLDLAMPGMDGLKLMEVLHADPAMRSIPVVLLTAIAERDKVIQARKLGARDYLLKSRFSSTELRERIMRHLAPSSEPASASPPATEMAPLLTRGQALSRVKTAMHGKALSGVVGQVIALAGSPRSDLGEIAHVIAKDAVLCARVLQVANSVAYRPASGPVTTIAEAARHIGCSTLRNIAAALSIFDAMPESGPDGFNPIRCWQHSFGVATICERLTAHDSTLAPISYLAGLCHDLGEILFRTHFSAEYRQVLEVQTRTKLPLHEVEQQLLSVTRGELALRILRAMGLPEAIERPIELLHNPADRRASTCTLARILRLADDIGNGMLLASSPHALIRPFDKLEIDALIGTGRKIELDGDVIRTGIFSLTGLLGRITAREHRGLLEPLLPKSSARILLVRSTDYSELDPIAYCLKAIAEPRVAPTLPREQREMEGIQGMLVVSHDPQTPGVEDAEIDRAVGLAGQEISVLRLVGDARKVDGVKSGQPLALPVELARISSFVESLGTTETLAAA